MAGMYMFFSSLNLHTYLLTHFSAYLLEQAWVFLGIPQAHTAANGA